MSRSRVTKADFLCLTKIINLRLHVDDLYCVCQSLYHNLAFVGPAVVGFCVFFHLPCRSGKCSAALGQIFVDEDLFDAAVRIA